MKLIVRPLYFFALLLIRIGDGVLWLGKLLLKIAAFPLKLLPPGKALISSLLKKLKRPQKTIDVFSVSGISKKSTPLPKPLEEKRRKRGKKTYEFPFFFWRKKQRKRKPIAKQRQIIKRIVVPHFPLLTKIKYFLIGTVFSCLFVFVPLIILVFLQELPNPRGIWIGQIPQTTKIYDRNGTLLHQLYTTQNRTLVPLDTIPTSLQNATIAIEDKDFYKHPGFDLTAIIRSIVENAQGKDLQGGSTLTQQLIKSALLSPETSLQRKVKEVILAFWTERMYTKKQILEMYLNQIPYGGTAWGVEAASETYFGKQVKDLTLAESAFLAGIPRAPSIYSPYGLYPTLWKKRQQEVLNRMVELGYVSKQQAQEAAKEDLQFRSQPTPMHAPHFVTYVKNFLIRKYGIPVVEKGGLSVTTSLDLPTQEMAQKIVTDEVVNDAALNISNGAALVTNPTNGDILAMVGSKDFSDPDSGNVNLTTSLRQPGSTVKLITYTAALQKGYTAATPLDDSPFTARVAGGPSYSPVNYDGRSHGVMPLRFAFGNSFNITAVRTLNNIGVATMVNLAKKMGVKNWGEPEQYGLPVTLGAAEATMVDMATVFGTIANRGVRVDPNPLLKVTDYKGNVLEEKQNEPGIRVVDEGIAFIIADMIADNGARAIEFGTNSPLYIPGQYVSVKTGTSDNKRDNWTIGFTKNRLVAVWVGNNDNSPMSQELASGITGAAPIWNKIMKDLLAKNPSSKGAMPANVIQKNCQGRIEYFIKGTENSVNCAPPSPSPTPTPGS